jgi:hypothetical protein
MEDAGLPAKKAKSDDKGKDDAMDTVGPGGYLPATSSTRSLSPRLLS